MASEQSEVDEQGRYWATRLANLMNEMNAAEYGVHDMTDFDGTGGFGIHPFTTGRRVADVVLGDDLVWGIR